MSWACSMAELPDLVAQARELLRGGSPLEELIEKLERYSEDFDLWYASSRERIEAGLFKEADNLLTLHDELIDKAQDWLRQAGADLAKHKVRGKGILAYTDVLPKRISVRRTRKG